MMNRDAARAVEIARRIASGDIKPEDIDDEDWGLLLQASGLDNPRNLPLLVSHRILQNSAAQVGYFQPPAEEA